MSTVELERRGDEIVRLSTLRWEDFAQKTVLECRVLLCPEEIGYSIHALDLPGVVSQGKTIKEAIENIIDAFEGSIASYKDSGMSIPWGPVVVEFAPKDSRELRILVNA
ncbi:MAG TPA: type II toxin-antitoxin system HicB family antitoxin [Pirellulales bacterium]|jgi:predicted RNase H-like HicB family nuclease|nr:type II toxin-antitoxin system HicB family antitoxin [Pirellulales bacterium]